MALIREDLQSLSEVNAYLEQVFPETKVRETVLRMLGKALAGQMDELPKVAWFLGCKPASGRTAFCALLHEVFGEALAYGVFTPDLRIPAGVRVIILEEQIYGLHGPYARNIDFLYQQRGCLIIVNTIYTDPVNDSDLVVPFRCQFVDTVNNTNQILRDNRIYDKLERWAPAMKLILQNM
jgi:hypothetical protein